MDNQAARNFLMDLGRHAAGSPAAAAVDEKPTRI
jgi:hypothetical protein